MIEITEDKDGWIVTLNGTIYTSCDTIEDARREANMLRKNLRYGA